MVDKKNEYTEVGKEKKKKKIYNKISNKRNSNINNKVFRKKKKLKIVLVASQTLPLFVYFSMFLRLKF